MHPAIHHNPAKQAVCRFVHRGEHKKIVQHFKDRAAALTHIKAFYPGAKNISIVFFVKAEESQDEPS